MTPRVSVLMTIYNSDLYLKEAIDSLINQSFMGWELIAVENGSSDKSIAILNNYQDSRIRVFPFSENIGRTPALRFAFKQAQGEFIAVLDSDDVSRPERISEQISFLDLNPEILLVGSWVEYIDESSNILSTSKPYSDSKKLLDCLGWMNPITHSSVMFRKSAAKEVGGYPEELIYAQDYGLIISLAQSGEIAIIPKFLCKFRILSSSMSNSLEYALTVAIEGKMLLYHALNVLNLSSYSRRQNRRAIAICDIKIGIILIKQKNIVEGIKVLLKGVMSDPSSLFINGKTQKILNKISIS